MIPRLYVTQDLRSGAEVAADDRAQHYLRNVMRRGVSTSFAGQDREAASNLMDARTKSWRDGMKAGHEASLSITLFDFPAAINDLLPFRPGAWPGCNVPPL